MNSELRQRNVTQNQKDAGPTAASPCPEGQAYDSPEPALSAAEGAWPAQSRWCNSVVHRRKVYIPFRCARKNKEPQRTQHVRTDKMAYHRVYIRGDTTEADVPAPQGRQIIAQDVSPG